LPVEIKILSKKELRNQKKKLVDEPPPRAVVSKGMDQQKNSEFMKTDVICNSNEKEHVEFRPSIDRTLEKAKQDAEEERLNAFNTVTPARVVQNHSSYCKGLKPVLIRLQKLLPGCTIMPGEISQGNNHCEEFELRFQRKTDDNTYKFVARSGQTIQDVSISIKNSEVFTEELICECIKKAIGDRTQQTEELSTADVDLSNYNRYRTYERQSFWKREHEQYHLKMKEQEHEVKRQQEIKKHTRRLATKGISSDVIEEYAERDIDIISGKNRSRHSMKG